MKVDPVRSCAVKVLLRVFEQGAYLSIALDKAIKREQLSPRGRRFLANLVYGTVRYKLLCDFVLDKRVNQPLDKLPAAILVILRMGVYQSLFCSQVTPPAMVHTSVDLARKYGHAGVARLVNAVLRRVPSTLEAIEFPDRETEPLRYLSVRYSMPGWLVERWSNENGVEDVESLCRAYNREMPDVLHVNTAKTSPDELVDLLARSGYKVSRHENIPDALVRLEGPMPTTSKLFRRGLFTVADGASMLAPHLLEPKSGEKVLDMCAAPGVKTSRLALLGGCALRVVAMDVHRRKLGRLVDNVARMGLECVTPVCGDGAMLPFAGGFDRVLLDAPCSGLGTLRRRPDLKWRAGPDWPERMAGLQRVLLRSAIGLCKNGGVVVYSVCTTCREETDDVFKSCLSNGGVAPEDGPSWLAQWKTNPGTYRTNPIEEDLDGFFLMRLRKVS